VARYAYERLSAQDASFLWAERECAPMHVGAVGIMEAGPLRNPDGGVDIRRYRDAIESVLHWIPRYRQKLAWTPFEGWPVWVDDRHFEIGYHLRHLSLARPGTLDQLKELASRILARPLDRARPLWEIWVIEGLEGGEQFALINKVHHCMIDGAAGADLAQILMSPSPSVELAEPLAYLPRPAPTGTELLLDSLRTRIGMPAAALRDVVATRAEGEPSFLEDAVRRARSLADLTRFALEPASETPINGDLSPHRRIEWLTMPLDDVRELRGVLGCTVNDIVLATVAGALRRYFFRRRVDPAKLDFRVAAPVSVRKAKDERRQGNHVSTWIVRLPLAESDPIAQIDAVHQRTEALKRSQAALGADTVMKLAEWLPPAMIEAGVAIANGPANTIVTNVPGPQFPLYVVGAPMLGMYPMVPLIPGCGLGIALLSYDGKLCWGFNADYELMSDVRLFCDDVCVAFEELRRATVSRFMERRTAPAIDEREIAVEGPEAQAAALEEEKPLAAAAEA
jgi:WS/DGAT/MGAT family acyltransferase